MESLKKIPNSRNSVKSRPIGTVIALGWVSFFTDISSEMIYPLLPVFLSTLGAGTVAIGFVAGLSESTASFFRVISGVLSDRMQKRKAAIAAGYGLSALSRPILASASSWGEVLLFRIADRAGKGIRTPPRDALISESSLPQMYGRSFGIQRAMDTAGAVVGPVLATTMLAAGMTLRSLFWISAIPAFAAVAVLLAFVREPIRKSETAKAIAKSEEHRSAQKNSERILLSRDVKLYLLVTGVFYLGNSSSFFLILRARDLVAEAGSPWFKESLIPILYLAMNLTSAVLSYPAGRIADRLGRGIVAFSGYIVFAASYAAFAFVKSPEMLWLLFPFQGLHLALSEGVGSAFLAQLLPENRRATGFALYHTVMGLSLLPAGVIGGWLWREYNPRVTFLAGSLLAIIAASLFGFAILYRSYRTLKTAPEEKEVKI